jgi:hypothetical protein
VLPTSGLHQDEMIWSHYSALGDAVLVLAWRQCLQAPRCIYRVHRCMLQFRAVAA